MKKLQRSFAVEVVVFAFAVSLPALILTIHKLLD